MPETNINFSGSINGENIIDRAGKTQFRIIVSIVVIIVVGLILLFRFLTKRLDNRIFDHSEKMNEKWLSHNKELIQMEKNEKKEIIDGIGKKIDALK